MGNRTKEFRLIARVLVLDGQIRSRACEYDKTLYTTEARFGPQYRAMHTLTDLTGDFVVNIRPLN